MRVAIDPSGRMTVVIAKRPIQAGEEITVDYGLVDETLRDWIAEIYDVKADQVSRHYGFLMQQIGMTAANPPAE